MSKKDKKNNVINFGENKRGAKINRYFQAQSGECYLCGEPMTLSLGFNNTAEVEHVVPKGHIKVKGKFNEAAAGAACNRFKADSPLHKVITELRQMKLCASHEPNAGTEALKRKKYQQKNQKGKAVKLG